MYIYKKDEAKEAYLYSFEQKYTSKSLLRLLEIYSNEYNIQGSLEIVNRLVILYEFTYNNNIVRIFFITFFFFFYKIYIFIYFFFLYFFYFNF